MFRDYKYFAFTLLYDISNSKLGIGIEELFDIYEMYEEEIEEYYEWLAYYTKEQ